MPKQENMNFESLSNAFYSLNLQEVWLHADYYYDKPWTFLTDEQTFQVAGEVAKLVGLKPEDDARTRIYLVEDMHEDGSLAVCNPIYNDKDEIDHCEIYLHKSCESLVESVPYENEEKQEHYISEGVLDPINAKSLTCELKSPEELLVAMLAEELSHAKLFYKARTRARLNAWEEKFSQDVKKHKYIKDHLYGINLLEVVGGLDFLDVLSKYFKDSAPERSQYFKNLKDEAIHERIRVIPDKSSVIEYVMMFYTIEAESEKVA